MIQSIVWATTESTGVMDELLDSASSWRSSLDLINTIFGIIVGVLTLLPVIYGVWKKWGSPLREYKGFVDRVYTKENRKDIEKLFIPTRAQDIDPCEQDEIRDNNGNFISNPLIPFFCNDAFGKNSRGKYYLVLADSGMGKTTFLLRLYRDCLLRYSMRRTLNVKFVPLSLENCLSNILDIQDKDKTILLLDALDENKEAINDYGSFFGKLLTATEEFNKIVITCRTQFFPNRAVEPGETGRIKVGTGNKKEEITKKYISPFSDEEVKRYLKKMYWIRKNKREIAYQIIKKVPVLMARPIILNWISFLCDAPEDFVYSYQIYNTIIDKWIERENIGHTNKSLFELSRTIADGMYSQKSTTMSANKVEAIAKSKKVQLEPIIAKSRSLLNRNGNGEYKFAHRSFLEFFIVFGIFDKMQMPKDPTFLFKLSGAKRFIFEILLHTAELTDRKAYSDNIAEFEKFKHYVNADSILDLVSNKEVSFGVQNVENGFAVYVFLNYIESDESVPKSLLLISDDHFVEVKSDGRAVLRTASFTRVRLTFITRRGVQHPKTLMGFTKI